MTTAAMERLWEEMHAPLLRVIARRVSDPRDAEDVLQDVMLRIQRQSREIDEFRAPHRNRPRRAARVGRPAAPTADHRRRSRSAVEARKNSGWTVVNADYFKQVT